MYIFNVPIPSGFGFRMAEDVRHRLSLASGVRVNRHVAWLKCVLSSACRGNVSGGRCCQEIIKIVSTANGQANGIVGLEITSCVNYRYDDRRFRPASDYGVRIESLHT
jgi:hypothetical protein